MDLEDMVYREELTHDEIVDILVVIFFPASTTRDTLAPRMNKISDINLMLKSLFPNKVKVIITIDDIRLRTNLTKNKAIRYTEKLFPSTILGFAQTHSGH